MRDHRDRDHPLIWFDPQMIRQIASSICIVCTSAGGAFILSYFTPTVGLGCRSAGYMIYVVITVFLFLVEILCWGLRTNYLRHRRWVPWISHYVPQDSVSMLLQYMKQKLKRADTGKFTKAGRSHVKRVLEWWEKLEWTDIVDVLLRVAEAGNLIWLSYIVAAQTRGSYNTCDCISSIWAAGGGYTDFEQVDYYRIHGILSYWGFGTGLSCAVLVVGLAYIMAEYCSQSHLATEDFGNAIDGIKLTRRFKKYTYWLRMLLYFWDHILLLIWKSICLPWQKVTGRQGWQRNALNKTLKWDWQIKPNTSDQALNEQSRRPSSAQPLMGGSQDERRSRNSQTPERSEGEGPNSQTYDSQQHDTRDESPSRIRLPILQLPTPTLSRYGHSQPPSPSSETSLSPGPWSHRGD